LEISEIVPLPAMLQIQALAIWKIFYSMSAFLLEEVASSLELDPELAI
jgi:hypothetical protein